MAIRDLAHWGRGDRDRSLVSGRETEHPFLNLHREVNRLFDDVFRGFGASGQLVREGTAWPRLDIDETEQGYRVTADLPGLEEKDVEVSLADGVLTIKGETRQEAEERGRGYSERYVGRFERRVALGPDIDDAKANASFRNGVLTVELPRSAEAADRTRRIPINQSPTSH